MSFTSPGFLFAFMPAFFLAYFALPAGLRNAALLVASLCFYSIDGGYVTAVLMVSVVINHFVGRAIRDAEARSARLSLLWFGIVLNLAPLIYYKYWAFLLEMVHDALAPAGIAIVPTSAEIFLPAGISFFTFQGLSYLVDIYRGAIAPAKSIIDFGMYHTLFPQLIAGPIVRYAEVADRIQRRPLAIADVEAGILRFCFGLGKKIIIADSMGSLADRMFGLAPGQLTTTAAWLGALSYTLQIYYDFSGYSDMAIGLGRMLGFRFPENFDLPYRSRSITEFWRRWHMTLSRWFRDYVYVPLGGNRAGPVRTYVNLLTVFVLCGLWHGAAYTFLIWGCYHGALLVAERVTSQRQHDWSAQDIVRWPLTMLLVVIGWVVFRSPNLGQAVSFLKAMAGFGAGRPAAEALVFFTPDKMTFFAIGAVLSVVPVGRALLEPSSRLPGLVLRPVQQGLALLLFLYASVLIAANGFNPFIYFRF